MLQCIRALGGCGDFMRGDGEKAGAAEAEFRGCKVRISEQEGNSNQSRARRCKATND